MSGMYVDESECLRRRSSYDHEAIGGIQCGSGRVSSIAASVANGETREEYMARVERERRTARASKLRTGETTAG